MTNFRSEEKIVAAKAQLTAETREKNGENSSMVHQIWSDLFELFHSPIFCQILFFFLFVNFWADFPIVDLSVDS